MQEFKARPGVLSRDVDNLRELLRHIGGPARSGTNDTPHRWAKALDFWTAGYDIDPASLLKTFEDGSEQYDEMITVGGIAVYSLCEHHITPFFGVAHIGYIPNGKIVGLSKFARVVDAFARRLQVQERLTQQIASVINDALKPRGVGVVLRCRHLCMESRGVRQTGSHTFTSALHGAIKEKPEARAEFMEFVKQSDHHHGKI